MKNPISTLVIVATISVMAASCTKTIDNRGHLPQPEQLAAIKPGKSTREDVQALLGSPSTTLNYGDESWQYVSAKSETTAFFKPKFVERQAISITFDRAGLVKNVITRNLEDGQVVEIVDRETPTAGKELSILEQVVGNVGRFSKDSAAK
jgi:outer membrane protein assembly factor BamE (lipoprotein component of BamABCDE complex)